MYRGNVDYNPKQSTGTVLIDCNPRHGTGTVCRLQSETRVQLPFTETTIRDRVQVRLQTTIQDKSADTVHVDYNPRQTLSTVHVDYNPRESTGTIHLDSNPRQNTGSAVT